MANGNLCCFPVASFALYNLSNGLLSVVQLFYRTCKIYSLIDDIIIDTLIDFNLSLEIKGSESERVRLNSLHQSLQIQQSFSSIDTFILHDDSINTLLLSLFASLLRMK